MCFSAPQDLHLAATLVAFARIRVALMMIPGTFKARMKEGITRGCGTEFCACLLLWCSGGEGRLSHGRTALCRFYCCGFFSV